MQARHAVEMVPPLVAAGMADQALELSEKMDQMIKLMDESVHLQRVALLESGHILRFHSSMAHIALSLPDAQDDYMQRVILRTRQFYEHRLLHAVQALGLIKPKATVCDIGANIGNASVYFGKVLGARRVIAFEPQPQCHATLVRNLELNALTDAQAYNCMVGATSGRGNVARFNPRNLGATRFVAAKGGAVPMVALDDLIEAEEMNGLSFVKIDVEGMHMDVLNGAKKVITTFKPAIWIGLTDPGALATPAKMLGGLGYSAQQIGPNDHIFTTKA